jgi:RHS repeat-associated protein
LDDETGLHYFGARYYDAQVGRFVSVDPLYVESVGDMKDNPQGLNIDSYIGGNPINGVDPSGKAWEFPEGAEHVFGINGGTGFFAAGSPAMNDLERLPNMYQTALFHDSTVDYLKTDIRLVDPVVNVCTMVPAFEAALKYNIATTIAQTAQTQAEQTSAAANAFGKKLGDTSRSLFNKGTNAYRWSFENLTVPRVLNEFYGHPLLDPSTWDSFRKGELPNPLPFEIKMKIKGEVAA